MNNTKTYHRIPKNRLIHATRLRGVIPLYTRPIIRTITHVISILIFEYDFGKYFNNATPLKYESTLKSNLEIYYFFV